MSAVRARGVCPRGPKDKVRFRNRAGARKGLDRARKACVDSGIPEELHPAVIYRCAPRERGGCGGWHMASDRGRVLDWLARNDPQASLDPHYLTEPAVPAAA